MQVIIVHEGPETIKVTNTQSGTENLAAIFGGTWHSIRKAWHEKADFVLTPGTSGIADFLIKNGKSPNWGKVVMMQESGFSAINSHWYFNKLKQANFDAFLVYNLEHLYGILDKPVFKFKPAYPFHKQSTLHVPKDPRKVGLYLSRFFDPTANLLGTLAVFKKLPPDTHGFCFLGNPEYQVLQQVLHNLGFADRIHLFMSKSWEEYLAMTSDFKLFLSMDFRMTWGRFDLDAAMVRSRCVGAHTAVKEALWPELVVKPDDVEGAATLALGALNEPDYIIPPEKAAMFSYPEVEKHIRNCLATL